MHAKFLAALEPLFFDMLKAQIGPVLSSNDDLGADALHKILWNALQNHLDSTTNMDSDERFLFIATSLQPLIIEHCMGDGISESATPFINHLRGWRDACADLLKERFLKNREDYSLSADATPYLGLASSKMYRFIRVELGVPFLRTEDLAAPDEFPGASDCDQSQWRPMETQENEADTTPTVGGYITRIYEALRNGVLYKPAMECLKEALEG